MRRSDCETPAGEEEQVFIALGGNIGDRENALNTALEALEKFCTIVASSDWIETAPVGGEPGQPNYLNGVVEVRTSLSPLKLLRKLLQTEIELGRLRGAGEKRWGPRVIDLDLLLFGERVIDAAPELILPHPRMHQRQFVLQPLCQIAPQIVHPVAGKTAAELLRQL